jgi:hypothetical protein
MIRIKVSGYAATELDMMEEVAVTSDPTYRLAAQWTGTHIVAFDAAHADVLASIASEIANDTDKDIDSGMFDDCPQTKRQQRAVCRGLWSAATRLRESTIA